MKRAAVVLVMILATGCSTVRPDYVTAALVHQSVPMKGQGPSPLGDGYRSAETNLDGVQVGAAWERGRWFGDASLTYALRSRNLEGEPWLFTGRVGAKFRLP